MVKRIMIITMMIICVCIFNDCKIKAEQVDEQDNFIEVLITLKEEESQMWKVYTTADFSDIDCIDISDLTSSYNPNIINKGTKSIDIEGFNRILKLTLEDNEISDITNKLKKRDYIKYIDCIECQTSNDDILLSDNIEPLEEKVLYDMWGLNAIHMYEARTISDNLGKNVMVGIVDSGIDHNIYGSNTEKHDDFDNIIDLSLSRSVMDGNNNPLEDNNGHGTFVSGIIGATRNLYGIDGVSNDVTLVSLKIDTTMDKWIQDFIDCLNHANQNGIRIINASLAAPEGNNALYDAISNYQGLIVCGAGNSKKDIDINPVYPAAYNLDNIIVVGAIDKDFNIWNEEDSYYGSNYGENSVDLFAPGVDIHSTYYNNRYGKDSGTSYATAYVTGVASLVLSLEELSEDGFLSTTEIKNIILTSVTPVDGLTNLCTSGGVLNAFNCLRQFHNHTMTYQQHNNECHIVKCSCGYQFLENHIWRMESINKSVSPDVFEGLVVCGLCGARKLVSGGVLC